MRTVLCLVVALSIGASDLTAQSVHSVSAGGGGDFFTLQAAIDAAASGDVVLIRPGEYAGATLSGKALSLLAADGTGVVVTSQLFIEGLPAGTLSVLNGLEIEGATSASEPGLRAEHCAGTLWVQSCDITGSEGVGSVNASTGVRVTDCADVVFLRSDLRGGTAPFSEFFNGGRTGLAATSSTVWAFESVFWGTNGKPGDDSGGSGGHGATLSLGSQLFSADGDFRGGVGGAASDEFDVFCECFQCGSPGSGGSGLQVNTDSAALLHASRVKGASGGPHVSTGSTGCAHGSDGSGLSLVGDGSTATMIPGETRGLRITPLLFEEAPLEATFFGEAGEFAWLLVGLGDAGTLLPGKLAPLLVDPASAVLLPVGALPPGGLKLLTLEAPRLPAGFDVAVVMSQAYYSSSGQLANATPTVILSTGL